MKIALKFHDNDMYFTFMGVFEALANLYEIQIQSAASRFGSEWKCFLEDKSILKRIINDLSYPMYELHQNQYRNSYQDSETVEFETVRMRNWLKINQGDLFIGDEIDNFLQTEEFEGVSVFIMLDTNVYERKYWITSVVR